jgi:hypothetical protein
MESEFYIVPSLYDKDTYFLFRDYGNEIKFTVINGMVTVSGKGYFTPKELEYVKTNFSRKF